MTVYEEIWLLEDSGKDAQTTFSERLSPVSQSPVKEFFNGRLMRNRICSIENSIVGSKSKELSLINSLLVIVC